MKSLVVSPECHQLGLRARGIVLRGVRVAAASPALRAEIDEEGRRLQQELATPAAIRALPEMVAHYAILRRVGVKPRSHPPSTQKLLEFALRRGTLPSVNILVDAYNLQSLRSRCSLGAHDLERIALPVALRLFTGDESFRPLGSTHDELVVAGEFGYVDAQNRVLCRLDSLQADFSKVQGETTAVLLIVEATTATPTDELNCHCAEAAQSIVRHCGGAIDDAYD